MERIAVTLNLSNIMLQKQGNSFLDSQVEIIEQDLKDQYNYKEISFVEYKEENISDDEIQFTLYFDVVI